METIKTAVVVTCLLGVLYGVYTILNKPDPTPPPEVAAAFEQSGMPSVDIDFEGPGFETPAFDESEFDTGYAPADGGAPEISVPDLGAFPSPSESVASPNSGLDAGSSANGLAQAPPIAPPLNSEVNSETPPALAPFAGPETNTGPPNDATTELAASVPDPSMTPPLVNPLPTVQTPPTTDSFGLTAPPIAPGTDALPPGITAPPTFDSVGSTPSPGDGIPAEPTVTPNVVAPNQPLPNGMPESPLVDNAGASEQTLRPFERARRTAKAQIDAGQMRQALFTLSLFYNDPELTTQERAELLDLLDPLAGRVIYSREHLLTSAHVTAQGETIESIAAKYQVPTQLLVNINGIQRPDAMTSGMELKAVPGPFRRRDRHPARRTHALSPTHVCGTIPDHRGQRSDASAWRLCREAKSGGPELLWRRWTVDSSQESNESVWATLA